MTVKWHQRSDWVEPGYPVTGPAFDPAPVEFIVVHYGAVPWSEERLRDTIGYWRSTQRYYVNDRGYSIGYQWGVARGDASVWELRGFTFRNAANGSLSNSSPYRAQLAPNPNVKTVSLHVILPMSGEYLPHQLDACRAAVAAIRARVGRTLPVIPHSDVTQTSCPGDPMRRAIAAGLLEPVAPPPPPPPPPPPEAVVFDHVYAYVTSNQSKNPAVFVQLKSNQKVWLPTQAAYNAHREMARTAGYRFKLLTYSADQFAALGPVIGPRPARTDEWGL